MKKLLIVLACLLGHNAARAFSPATIPGLAVWLRADTLTNAAGTVVTNWPDVSGHNNSATNANVKFAPTLNTNRLNGYPALTGDGTNAWLATPPLTLGSNFTIFTVAQKRSTNTADVLSIGAISNNPTFYMLRDVTYVDAWFTTFWQSDACGAFDTTKPIVESFLCSGSNQIQFINGAGCLVGAAASFNISGPLCLMSQCGQYNFWGGDIAEVLLYTNTLTQADHALVVKYLLQKYLPGPHLSFYGDSLTYGQNAPYQQSYPCQAINLLGGFENHWQAEDLGIGGEPLFSYGIHGGNTLLPLQTPGLNRTGQDFVGFWFGANDWAASGSTNVFYSSVVSQCQLFRQQGLRVVLVDVLPRGAAGGGGPGFESWRLQVNAMQRANWPQFADAFCDIGADPTIGTTNALTNSLYYNADQTHLTALGYSYVATNFYHALLTVPPVISAAPVAGKLVLNWVVPFTLQSATTPLGPYNDLTNAASPYTNLNNAPQLFFRLRN